MKLTHSSVGSDESASDEHDQKIRDFITELKRRNPNIKVLMAIGGWDVGSPSKENYADFSKSINSEEFATKIILRLEELNFDGFDFDLEGPDIPTTIDNIAFSLSPKLKEKNMLMTAALFSLLDRFYSNFSNESLFKLDFINVMSYNYKLASFTTNPGNCASLDDFDKEIIYWMKKEMPLNKLVLGVPYYSQLWEKKGGIKITDSQPTYSTVYNNYLLPNNDLNYYAQEPELIYETTNEVGNKIYIDCNNIAIMREKANRARKLGGIMCWEFGQDLFIENEIEKSLSWNIQDVLFKE